MSRYFIIYNELSVKPPWDCDSQTYTVSYVLHLPCKHIVYVDSTIPLALRQGYKKDVRSDLIYSVSDDTVEPDSNLKTFCISKLSWLIYYKYALFS